MNWQAADAGMGAGADDPFATVESQIRAMAATAWWRSTPPQRTQAVIAHLLAGAGEWWLFGAWGRWYRCGLDGHWHPCPPPTDPAARRVVTAAPPGAGNPPVPAQLIPAGPDLASGRVASAAFLGPPPETTVVARVQQALITALSVNPAQFALHESGFAPGTPSTVAATWATLLWCAGSPVVPAEHPLIELFVPYLTALGRPPRWLPPPDLPQLTAYYRDRLAAGDGVGAAHIVRVMHDVATGLRGDPRFRPGAEALSAITAATLPMVAHDMTAARFGPAAIVQEWRRRCPGEYAIPMLRDGAPGEYLRLCLYDLTEIVTGLRGGTPSLGDARRAGVAVLAADLHSAPQAIHAVPPWLDADGARTLQAVLAQPDHPLRELWPRDGRLPGALRTDDAEQLHALLATAYTAALAWCRLAQIIPPAPGFAIPAATAAELTSPALRPPHSGGEPTPWEIIEAARAHLAAEAAERSPAPPPPPGPPSQPPPPPVREPPPAGHQDPAPTEQDVEPGVAAPDDVGARVVESYGTRFLCGVDDVDELLTEVRRRGAWARRLRGEGRQEVSSASAPALLLLGA
ncbi:MAG: hypothetical protein ACRDOO_20165, partial [Actinomadura sp.]